MDLTGGINMYSMDINNIDGRHLSSISPYGRKVIYLGKGGWENDTKYANAFFKTGQELTVSEIYVGRSSSTVSFIECPDKQFNTIMFEDIIEQNDNPMYGTLIRDFRLIDLRFLDNDECEYDEEDIIIFNKGETVEIVRELEDESFASGKGYLILSDEYESITVDVSFVETINK